LGIEQLKRQLDVVSQLKNNVNDTYVDVMNRELESVVFTVLSLFGHDDENAEINETLNRLEHQSRTDEPTHKNNLAIFDSFKQLENLLTHDERFKEYFQ